MKKNGYSLLCCLFLITGSLFAGTYTDSIMVSGQIKIDTLALKNVEIAGVKTDADGYFSIQIPSNMDTVLVPSKGAFIFTPESYSLSGLTASVDTLNFQATRTIKKTIIISGQSNAEQMGVPKLFISDAVDKNIPYYLAYCMGDYGLSTLGMLNRFGKTYSYCAGYDCGFGFEILLARTLYKNYSDSLAVIKLSYSGTSLYEGWQPNGSTWAWFEEKHNRAEVHMRAIGYEPEYVGVFWFQGESDEDYAEAAASYSENLNKLITRFRNKFQNDSPVDSLPFVCAQINWNQSSPYEQPIREAQMAIRDRDFCSCIDVDECNRYRFAVGNQHFNGGALNRIGYKFATEYLDMLGTPIDSNVVIKVTMTEALDTTVVLTVEGDTSFTHVMDDIEFDIPTKYGDSLYFTLNIGEENAPYTCKPFSYLVDYVYDTLALKTYVKKFTVGKVVGVEPLDAEIDFAAISAYPNPFNPCATVEYNILETGLADCSIYNLQGQRVAVLFSGYHEAGAYRTTWNASAYPSGLYILKLNTAGSSLSKKICLMK